MDADDGSWAAMTPRRICSEGSVPLNSSSTPAVVFLTDPAHPFW
jgi:hypothetical protein